jgi:protein-tyrosine phosphatase
MKATDAEGGPEKRPSRILTVCTGNICRSPLAERLLQAGLDERFPGRFIVDSAGTGALVGEPIDPQVAEYIRLFGGTAKEFSAKQLTPELLERQDLVLTLTRNHRSRVVIMAPSLLRRTFTLLEYARLISSVSWGEVPAGPEELLSANAQLLRLRNKPQGDKGNDDVVDPYRREASVYQDMARIVVPAVQNIVLRF